MCKLRVESVATTLILLGIVFASPLPATSQDISTLISSAQFTLSDKPPSAISYAQAESFLTSFLAFDRGSRVLADYKEPVLTRGAKGISIFRDLAPSVTLVVTGDDKNVDAIGTGVVIDRSGYVLTNWHVIAGHQDAVIFMKPPSGSGIEKKYGYYAQVVYVNPTPDLALLKLSEAPSQLPAVTVGDISEAQIAEDIHIIGHPHGQLWSYSTGVLSQIRSDYTWKYDDGSQHRARVLQMQTAINPGNSGGPVVDDSGKLIGLVAMFEEGQNLDYAISADVIKPFLVQAMSRQTRGVKHDPGQSDTNPTYAAPTDKGRIIYRSEYPELTVYWMVPTKGGQPSGLLIKDRKGNTVEAVRGTSTEGLSDWKATLGDGHVIHASSSLDSPGLFWAEATPPSK
jgi:S1-C subfamily serine protease